MIIFSNILLITVALGFGNCQNHQQLSNQQNYAESLDAMRTENSSDRIALVPISSISIPLNMVRYQALLAHQKKRDLSLMDEIHCDIVTSDRIESNQKLCCKHQIITDMKNPKNRDIQRDCDIQVEKILFNDTSDKLSECNHHTVTINYLICLNECIFRMLKIANVVGNLTSSSLASHVKTEVCTTEWQKSISPNVIDECQSEIKNYHQWDAANDAIECNPTSFQFTICLLRKFNEQCPFQHRCIQSNGKSTLQTSHDIDESQSQSDEQTKMEFVASRIPSRDHIIFSAD